jgi:hypothetical protein
VSAGGSGGGTAPVVLKDAGIIAIMGAAIVSKASSSVSPIDSDMARKTGFHSTSSVETIGIGSTRMQSYKMPSSQKARSGR